MNQKLKPCSEIRPPRAPRLPSYPTTYSTSKGNFLRKKHTRVAQRKGDKLQLNRKRERGKGKYLAGVAAMFNSVTVQPAGLSRSANVNHLASVEHTAQIRIIRLLRLEWNWLRSARLQSRGSESIWHSRVFARAPRVTTCVAAATQSRAACWLEKIRACKAKARLTKTLNPAPCAL